LLPTLFRVGSHLTSLQSVNLRHCGPLLNSVTTGFNRTFADFLKLSHEREVNMAILAFMSHQYFKLRWLPNSLADQRSHLQTLLVSSAKSMTNPTALYVPLSKSDDTDDDYFDFAATDCETTSSKDLNSTTKCELEALQFLEDQRKELVMLNCNPIIKRIFVHFIAALPSWHLWNAYSVLLELSPGITGANWVTLCLRNCYH
jgi:hypothetical protein